MTRYTVIWSQSASDDLAELWIQSPNRSAITAAADAIDDALSNDAAAKGDLVAEGLRAYSAEPLRAVFEVREDDRVVEIAVVRRIGSS